jgi:Uncharacterized protein, possibly involved in aromatic compounds catabolism
MKLLKIKQNYVKSSLEVKNFHKQTNGHGSWRCLLIPWLKLQFLMLAYFTQEGTWVGVNNNTDFIRAITDGIIICEATPIKLGKRSQIWEAKIFNNDTECARSTVRLTNIDKS